LGALDEEVLIGKKDEGKAWEDELGRHVPRVGGWGKVLGSARYHIWCENEVPGVTDGFGGEKWLTDRKGGESYKGKVVELKK
jgi:hypothetical protein